MADSPPQDLVQVVDPIFAQQGVPTNIWETVAQVESGFNPKAEGDINTAGKPTSFGLFQLHIGGQLPAQYNIHPEQVEDPALNARLAAPAIVSAYNQLKGQNMASQDYWTKFAQLSGHPGGGPQDPATQAEAQKLYQTYVSNNFQGGSSSNPNNFTPSTQADCSAWNPLTYGGCMNNYIQSNYVQPLEQSAAKVGIFLLAIVLVIVGFLVIGSSSPSKGGPPSE